MGSIARFWLASYLGQRMGARFPYGTFFINVSGSFLIGFVMTLLAEKTHLDPFYVYLIPIGFIGGYTTFSTFEFELLRSFQEADYLIAAMNLVLSVVIGFAMVWMGTIAAKSIT